MKRYRVALCGLILLMVLVMLNGCHAEYECTIQFQEGTEAEGMLELLIPLAEEDPEYREYKEIEGVRKSAPPVALQDGSTYRSIQWYSHLSDIRTNPGKTTLCFNAADEFLNLCETRQSFRIALVDSQGNLLQLSEEYPFQSGKQSYLVPPILYNPETNTVLPQYRYRQTFLQVIRDLILYWMMMIVPWSAIADLITILVRRWTGSASVSNRYYQLWLPALCLPSLIYLGCTLYEAFQSTLTSREAWKRFCELMHFFHKGTMLVCRPLSDPVAFGLLECGESDSPPGTKKTGPAAIIGFEATPSARQEGLCVWGQLLP